MGKIWIEVCLISARGLRRSSLLWKLQWFAVGWIDPNNKYCTKVDASGNSNPAWKTKFSTSVDSSESNFQDLALNVEVYSREPIFLRERLQGTATIGLKEFLAKYTKDIEDSKPGSDHVESFQLRKRNSSKPQGFVDISVRISEEEGGKDSYPGNEEGIQLMDHGNGNTLTPTADAYPSELPLAPTYQPETHPQANSPRPRPLSFPTANYPMPSGGPSYRPPRNHPQANSPHPRPMSFPTANYPMPSGGPSYLSAGGPSYRPPRTPPPPPPPANVGYIPTFLPRTDHLPQTYVNMPSSGRTGGPGFGMGMGAGALAAGAMIFGDDFMSGFDVPVGFQDASLTRTTDPPF